MSTTFDVYPRKRELPTFAAILDRSTFELHRFLDSVGIQARPRVHVRLQRNTDHSHLPFDLSNEARWGRDVYAWFMVGEVPGGTDAYYDDSLKHIRQFWEGEIESLKYKAFEPTIRQTMQVGHSWSFRRSAGQSAVTNVTYGLIAASLAALTDGFVHSVDSAWDWERLPAFPEDFLTWYFRPDLALEEDKRSWAARCIGYLSEELEGARK